MASNKKEKLFSQFPEVTTEQWESVIAVDLKGADYNKKLVWRTGEGFNVRPYYRAEDLSGIDFLGSSAGEFPYVRGVKPCNCWRIHESIVVKEPAAANEKALKAIKGGAESIGFELECALDAAQAAILLAGINPTEVEVVFDGREVRKCVDAIMECMKGHEPEQVRAAFMLDPIMWTLSMSGKWDESYIATIAGYIKKYSEYKHVRFTGVEGSLFNASGSTIVQELAFTLAAGHDYVVKLMEAGLTVEQAAKSIRFSMAVSSNYFMEIAKFRAARLLWANIMQAYEPKCCCAKKLFVHATTSMWNITSYDPYVNMLRGTTEAMSAALVGVHSLEVTPFNAAYEEPNDFSSHIARNVQLLLKHESHFDKVVDPAGGSYYIENLTKSIAEQAWALFKEVEEKGGYAEAFKAGFVSGKIEESAAEKRKNIATRRITLLGTNQFPNFGEVAGKEISEQSIAGCCCGCAENELPHLKPFRGAEEFELMRLKVDRSGKEPKAFMLTCGSLAMARARAQFSCNFFACAGIKVQDNTFFHSVEEGAEAALKSGAEIVVVCAADDDYATLAPKVKELIGDKAIVVVAGAPACQAELEEQGIKNFISVRQNVLETLNYYLKELGI